MKNYIADQAKDMIAHRVDVAFDVLLQRLQRGAQPEEYSEIEHQVEKARERLQAAWEDFCNYAEATNDSD